MSSQRHNEISFSQYLPSSKKKSKKPGKQRKKPSEQISSFLVTPGPVQTNSKRADIQRRNRTKKDFEQKIDADDYNIFHIDAKVKEKLKSKISHISDIQRDLVKTLWILNHGEDPVDRVLAKERAAVLRRRIQDLESTFELVLYIFRTDDILREYREMLSSTRARSFITLELQNDSVVNNGSELVSRYLCIAQEYITIDNLSYHPEKLRCPACQRMDFRLDDEDSTYICYHCQTEVNVLDDTPSFKDTDRVNMSSRYTYTKRGHFIDAMKRFQGIQNTDPKKIKKVVNILLDEMDKHNLKKLSQNRRERVSKDHLYMFLSENKLSSYYDDINLLHTVITGEPCPNISEFEDVILDDFEKQEVAYIRVQDPERINSLNVNYKLYKLLQRRGYICKKDDFYILKTKNKEDEHDEVLKKAWEILGWIWIET